MLGVALPFLYLPTSLKSIDFTLNYQSLLQLWRQNHTCQLPMHLRLHPLTDKSACFLHVEQVSRCPAFKLQIENHSYSTSVLQHKTFSLWFLLLSFVWMFFARTLMLLLVVHTVNRKANHYLRVHLST